MSLINKSKIFVAALFVSIPVLVSAQAAMPTDSVASAPKVMPKTINYPHLYWGFTAGYNMLEVTCDNKAMAMSNEASPTGGVFFELRINKWLGVETGANYMMLSGDIDWLNEPYQFVDKGLIDSDNQSYDATYSSTGLSETWDASYIEIPLSVKLQLMAGKWTFYLKPGASYNVLASSSYTQNGSYSRSGYYKEFEVTFENLPEYGFYQNSRNESSGKPAFTSFINPFLGLGFVFPAKRGNLFMEARYYPGSLTMVKEGNGKLFEGPENLGVLTSSYNFESMTEEAGEVSSSGLIFNIGFRF